MNEEYIGYSSYYFQHNLSHNHCVIGYAGNYKFAQTVLGFALFWFVLALSLGTPVAIGSVHKTLIKRRASRKDKRKTKQWKTGESNVQYYVRAIVMVAALVDVAIIVHDAWYIIAVVFADGLWNIFFTLAVGVFVWFLATDVVVCMIYSNSIKAFEEDFPFRQPTSEREQSHFCSLHCCSSNNEVVKDRIGWLRRAVGWLRRTVGWLRRTCTVGWLRRTAGILAVVVALQLLFIHGVYVFLGFIASPLSSTTIIIFYCTTIFCAVIFVAILLKKVSSTTLNCTRPSQNTEPAAQPTSEREQSHCESRKGQSNTIHIIGGSAVCTVTASEQAGLSCSSSTRRQSSTSGSVTASSLERGQRRPENQQHTIEKCKSTLESIGSILVGLLMLAFVVCFGVFIFITGMLVIEHNNNGGVLGFVGSLAPSAFLSLVGYCGKKLLDMGNAGVDHDQPDQITEQKPIHLIVSFQGPLQAPSSQPPRVQQRPSSQPCAPLQTSISHVQSTVDDTESPFVVSVAIEPRQQKLLHVKKTSKYSIHQIQPAEIKCLVLQRTDKWLLATNILRVGAWVKNPPKHQSQILNHRAVKLRHLWHVNKEKTPDYDVVVIQGTGKRLLTTEVKCAQNRIFALLFWMTSNIALILLY